MITENRKCTNVPFIFVWISFIIFLLVLLIYSGSKSDINRLTRGYDDCGNVCGRENLDLNISKCESEDMTSKPKLEVITKKLSFNRTIFNYKCARICEFDQVEIFNRCIKNSTIGFQEEIFAGIFSRMIQDIVTTWSEILVSCALAGIFSLALLILYRYAIESVIWFTYFGFTLIVITLAVLFWTLVVVKNAGYIVLALIMTLLTVMMIVILVWYYHRIILVAELFREATKALIDVSSVLFQPVFTFIAIAITVSIFIFINIIISTAGDPHPSKNIDGSPHVTFKSNGLILTAQIFNFIAFFWFVQMIFDCQHFVIAGAVSSWYFTRDKSKLISPIMSSLHYLVRYHLGSICLGSMVITFVKVLRMFFQSILNQKDGVCAFLACCCASIIETIENILKYLMRNVYIVIAKDGTPFIESGRKAFKLIWNNLKDVIALNQFGDLVLLMSQLMVMALASMIAYFMVNKPTVTFVWLPVSLVAAFSFLISHSFISVFEMTVDTIFLCFCEDIVENDGTSSPYFMSPELMDVMKKLKKEAGGDFNFTLASQPVTVCQANPQQQNLNLLYPVNRSAFRGGAQR